MDFGASEDAVATLWRKLEDNLCQFKEGENLDSEWNTSFDLEIRAMEELQSKLSERLVLRKRARNSAAPINQLPTEIIIDILRCCLPPNHKAQSRTRTTLALVCHLWHIVVESSPPLWSVICSEDAIGDVSRALSKSGQTQLDLVGFWSTPSPFVAQNTFLNVITAHSQRWRSLKLQLIVATPNFMAEAAAPQLEYLSFAMSERRWTGTKALNLFNGRPTPRLRHLSLHGVPVQWSTLSSPNLSTLTVRNIVNLGPSLSELFTALSRHSSLAVLSIISIPGLEDTEFEGGPVELPRLRTLTIGWLPVPTVHQMMETLKIPIDCQARFRLRVRDSPITSLFPPDTFHLSQRCVIDASQIIVTFSVIQNVSNTVRLKSNGLWSLDLTLDGAQAAGDFLAWFSSPEVVSTGAVDIPVRLELIGDEPRIDLFCRPLSSFNSIRRITLRHDFRPSSPSAVLRYLSIAAEHDQHSLSFPFPGLEELHVEKPTRSLLHDISTMLTNRYTLSSAFGSSPPLQRIIMGKEYAGGEVGSLGEFWPSPLSGLLDIVDSSGIQLSWWGKQLTGVAGGGILDLLARNSAT
ncbi:hypothetical protein FRC04_003664 [Tulasnella sp. 424]|nr:hypothetical protein FRC04_003664 [Tulasnella sp. 424]KAG8976999.1 hypothetical protein FRC05_002518 [Tulasnella sp. 425]